MRKRNTAAFTFLAWASFTLAALAMFIGIYTLDESLPVKGYYAVTALFLIMSSFVLQKTIRDNQEDMERFPPEVPVTKKSPDVDAKL